MLINWENFIDFYRTVYA